MMVQFVRIWAELMVLPLHAAVTPGVAYLLATNETGIIAPLTSSVAFVNVTVNSTVSSNSTAGRRLLADPVVATLTQNCEDTHVSMPSQCTVLVDASM